MPNFGFHIAPTYPVAGRLVYDPKKLSKNILKQQSDERVFSGVQEQKRLSEDDVAGDMPRYKVIHITPDFDRTSNNDKVDDLSASSSCSDIARLVHASIGSGDDINGKGIFKYYCPDMGTMFPDIKESMPSNMELIDAEGGENRINWELAQLADAPFYTLLKSRPKLSEVQGLVEGISANWIVSTLTGGLLGNGERKRRAALEPKPRELGEKLRQRQDSGQKPHILAMRLYVYGFSHEAAEARAFANRLQELTRVSDINGRVGYRFAGLPTPIELLGLFDTVAAVGLADSAPFAVGYMDWAGDTMCLPDKALSQCPPTILPGDCSFLKRRMHLVSCHEQCVNFPLDSIRHRDIDVNGRRTGPSCYQKWTVEYAYPSVHSGVSSGHDVGNQGGTVGGSELLLSQIVL